MWQTARFIQKKQRNKLHTVSWDGIANSSDTNKAYGNFTEIFGSLYGKCFPKKIKLKPQKYNNFSITSEIKKLFKRKQKLYEKFFKNEIKKVRTYINLKKVALNPLNVSLKVFIIRVKY